MQPVNGSLKIIISNHKNKSMIKIKISGQETVSYDVNPTFQQMSELAKEYSESNPDCCVTVSHHNGSFIANMTENQKRDEALLEMNLISWEEYAERNFPAAL